MCICAYKQSCIDSICRLVLVGFSRNCRCVPMQNLARHACVFGILGYSSSTLVQVKIFSLFGSLNHCALSPCHQVDEGWQCVL